MDGRKKNQGTQPCQNLKIDKMLVSRSCKDGDDMQISAKQCPAVDVRMYVTRSHKRGLEVNGIIFDILIILNILKR